MQGNLTSLCELNEQNFTASVFASNFTFARAKTSQILSHKTKKTERNFRLFSRPRHGHTVVQSAKRTRREDIIPYRVRSVHGGSKPPPYGCKCALCAKPPALQLFSLTPRCQHIELRSNISSAKHISNLLCPQSKYIAPRYARHI